MCPYYINYSVKLRSKGARNPIDFAWLRALIPWIACASALFLCACWAKKPSGPEPAWAAVGSGAFGGAQSRFVGVGRFAAQAKPKVLSQGADDMAHAAVSRVMDDYLDILTVDLNVPAAVSTAAVAAAQVPAIAPLSDDEAASVRLAAMDALKSRSKIVGRWLGQGSALSLCVMDFAAFKKELASSPELAPGASTYLNLNADAAWARLLSRQKPGR